MVTGLLGRRRGYAAVGSRHEAVWRSPFRVALIDRCRAKMGDGCHLRVEAMLRSDFEGITTSHLGNGRVAELDPHLGAEGYMIAEEVASSADVDPRTALDVLKLLLEQDATGMTAYALTSDAAPNVIARAIASGDEAAKQDAVAYMNHLGEKGNLSLEAAVNEILDGGVTRHDVKE